MIGQKLMLAGVQKRFGETWAVHETTLDIRAGEFVSIIGPSGSGKTTLLTMIAGFEQPTNGRIIVGDVDITTLPPNRRNVGMVFQKYALFPHLTVRQNIAFPLKMRRLGSKKDIRSRVDEMLELIRLNDFADRYPNQLSGGQQQRVAVARALVFSPPVILMDEPLGALDKKLREAMQFEIKRIQENLGATVIYVTHDQEEALTMSDRIVVMHDGCVQQVGTPSELYNEPNRTFVADFIGSINFIPATYRGNKNGKCILDISERVAVELDALLHPKLVHKSIGSEIRLAVRPEHVGIFSDPKKGQLSGTVEASVFIGSSTVVLVRLDAFPDIDLRVQLPATTSSPVMRKNSRVGVNLDTLSLLTFDLETRLAA
ncbi:vitamin B12 import ATP-binding protein BtuD [Brucella sp. NBRC 14130]|uniref:ABC transporter ATP-binding protein n=1 Tax=Brucella TaxID=234 RepID=UPI00159C1D91|nr:MULTISPECIES: ABC transporter ATP-binding protein [Brucella/Ochrobactrum group]NVM42939.1 ABC transporter ATP-binding protein [Brucella intermedia]